MNTSDASIANRVITATSVIFIGILVWLYALDAASKATGLPITGKLWLGAVLGSAFLADKAYTLLIKRKAKSSNVQNT